MEVTESGMVTLARLLQPPNAPWPMKVTELGIVTLVKLLQLVKAQSPMEVTELGIVTLARPRQPSNVLSAIPSVPSLIVILVPSGIVPLY